MAERAPDAVRYTAFLSYRHRDSAAAGKLHRRLETYRMPKRLAGAETARGPVPERLAPIFRDRDELPAATDLSEKVREALAESGALIILCSPSSAGSHWVGQEIETFRALHPDRPILAAIIDGDPPDCFPAQLRTASDGGAIHEPLATDLRPHGDGARLGLLKLVAGITGVGLDALVQRDAARRVRRVMAVTVAAVAAMLVMAGMTLIALDARREAERQRAEAERQRSAAEGQIEFMLTDLRDRLRGVGRIEIMEAVNANALSYYAGQGDLSSLRSDSLLRRARILHAIGEDKVTEGDMAGALDVFEQAYQSTSLQLSRAPGDPESQLVHARSEYWIGRIHELRRNWPVAQRHYLRFAAATDRLVSSSPNNPDLLREAAWGGINLGNVELYGLGNRAAAQAAYERAVTRFEKVARARPREDRSQRDLANAYGWLADSYFMRQLWRHSLAAREKQYRLVEKLHLATPADNGNTYRFALAQRAIAASLTKIGDSSRARVELFRAFDQSRRLAARDPRNAEWQLFKGMVACDLYYGKLGLPPTVSRLTLSQEIRTVDSVLRGASNPRAADLARCVGALTIN